MQYMCLINCSYAPTKLNICPVWLSYTVTQPVTYFPVERCQARHSPSWRGQEVPCHMQDTLQRTHPPSPQTFLLYKPNRQQISVKHLYFHNVTNATPYNCCSTVVKSATPVANILWSYTFSVFLINICLLGNIYQYAKLKHCKLKQNNEGEKLAVRHNEYEANVNIVWHLYFYGNIIPIILFINSKTRQLHSGHN